MERILIIGTGPHAVVVADLLDLLGNPAVGMVDVWDGAVPGIPHDAIVVGIGDNAARRAVAEQLVARGERLATVVHPFTSVARSVTIGEGVVLCAGAVVQARAVLGRGSIVNTNASVDHDSVLGDFSHLSAGVTVGARCHIGEEALLALGASVASDMRVGARTTIGCGAAVVRDIPEGVTAWGVPARVMR